MMSFKCFANGMGLLLLGASCSAGVSQAVYAAKAPGAYVSVGVTASGYESDYGKRLLGGGSIYVDANLTRRLGIELEGRRLSLNSDDHMRETTYLVGPRYSFAVRGFRPYAKFLVGRGDFNFPFDYAKGSYLAMAPGGGVDYQVGNSRLGLRLVDFEYQIWPQFTFGALHPYGVSAGISFLLFR